LCDEVIAEGNWLPLATVVSLAKKALGEGEKE